VGIKCPPLVSIVVSLLDYTETSRIASQSDRVEAAVMKRLSLCSLIAVTWFAAASEAHHYFAPEYEREEMITLDAVVTGVNFRNPHVRLDLEVRVDDGTTEVWAANSVSPRSVSRRGWLPETIAIGDTVTLYGNLGSNASRRLWIQTITLADGTEIFPVGRLPDIVDD